MKKFAFIIAFSSLFAIGMKAQTANPPKRVPKPHPLIAAKPPLPKNLQPENIVNPQQVVNPSNVDSTKNTVPVNSGKMRPVHFTTPAVTKPIDVTIPPKQGSN